MRNKVCLLLSLFCVSTALATDWSVYPETTDGMTGAQQITNALTKLKSGDTIRVNPGTYDFTGIAMYTYSKLEGGKTYWLTNHLSRNCAYSIVGVTDGHWNDAIVFKGDARCLDGHGAGKVGSTQAKISNITFDGFNAGNCPCGGSWESRGGALRFPDSYSETCVASNCVFRNCRAYIGGAVNGGVLVDCLVTNNVVTDAGGALCNTCTRNCRVLDNRANTYGAFYGHNGHSGTLFEGNVSTSYGGVGRHASAYPITNCVFRGNSSKYNVGGAIYAAGTAPGDIIDCRFETNKATQGGAIYQVMGDTVVPTRVRHCVFVGNSASSQGGAIYHLKPSFVRPYETCVFSNNFTTGSSSSHGGAAYNGVYSNCTFVGNTVKNGSGGAVFISSTGGVYSCAFTRNIIKAGSGAAIYQGILSNCVFTANVVSNGHGGAAVLTRSHGDAAWDCAFIGNVCWTNGSGGAVYGNGVCPFTRCVFTNNYSWSSGGALYHGACTNCTFFGNCAAGSRGVSIWSETPKDKPYTLNSRAVNCRFIENYRNDKTGRNPSQHTEFQGGDVLGTRMENCEVIDGAGSFWRCSMVNCHLHHFTNKLGHCVFGEESWATNCLIDHCLMNRKSQQTALFYRSHYYPDREDIDYRGCVRGKWVNCTFADNTLNNGYGMFCVEYYDKAYGPKMVADFENCIFYNNRKANGTLADLSGVNAYDVTLSNCVYGASDGTLRFGTTNGWTNLGGTFDCTNLSFVGWQGEKRGIAYYTPRKTSIVVGKGDATMFTEDDVDLANNPRLTKDGKLDLGCYTHTNRNFGCSLLFK